MISAALQMLYDEHETILTAVEQLESILSVDTAGRERELSESIEFFRTYADGYHHAKEERILFPRLVRANAGLEAITESLDDHHRHFREMLGLAKDALASSDVDNAADILSRYCADLRDHISAEDDELFVVADEVLGDKEKEEIAFLFEDSDRSLGAEAKQRMEQHVIGS